MLRAVPLVAALLGACSGGGDTAPPPREASEPAAPTPAAPGESLATLSARQSLVRQLRADGVGTDRVLAAIGAVPRHLLVPADVRRYAYLDRPLPIGFDQTISQPTVVALMTTLADVTRGEKVLEVGTGSGYQAAVLAELGAQVFSIEIVAELGRRARRDLDALGYGDRVRTRIGDGYRGWPEEAPFDAILLTAAPAAIPEPLERQLGPAGRLVAPVGPDGDQHIVVLSRRSGELIEERSIPVRFVPMTGRAAEIP